LPRDKDGNYYSRRVDLSDEEETAERILNARKYAGLGARIGGLTTPLTGPAGVTVGTALGAIGGFILGDKETVFPVDMVAIPAYQAFMIQGTPAFQIYIKEGEVLTQVIPTDAMVAEDMVSTPSKKPTKPRKKSKYHQAYSKHFKTVQGKYKLKNGKWAKDGFKRAGNAARKLAKAEVKK